MSSVRQATQAQAAEEEALAAAMSLTASRLQGEAASASASEMGGIRTHVTRDHSPAEPEPSPQS